MPSDRTIKHVPVEHEFTLYGLPARLIVELTTKRGHTIHVPIGDQAEFTTAMAGQGYSTIHIPVRGSILQRVADAVDDSDMAGL